MILHMMVQDTLILTVLRLYPPVPVNSRITAKNTTLPRGGGESSEAPVFMRKGEPVCYCPYIMHRRKDLYGPDANEFRPERWDAHVKEYNLSNIGWAYLPFNGGPRICLGRKSILVLEVAQSLMNEQKSSRYSRLLTLLSSCYKHFRTLRYRRVLQPNRLVRSYSRSPSFSAVRMAV